MKVSVGKKAWLDTIPVMTGYLVLGFGFGIVLRSQGYGVWWAAAMSIFIYAGSMQYVGIQLIAGAASLITVALTTLMVNARHLFYGISMVERYKNTGKRKPYLIFALTDETYSLVCTDPEGLDDAHRKKYYMLVSVMDQSYWVVGSIIGSLAGSILTFNTTGIDFSLTALFITVFTDQWLKNKDHWPAICGVVCSVVSLIVFGAENFLIPAMVLITTALMVLKHFRKEAAV